jgi:uncharacterized protein YjbJ (UPF0337 family)
MAAQPQLPRGETTPPVNPDPLTGQWEQLRPQLRSWFDRLTEADVGQIGGQKDRLVSLVQQRYGYTRERAQQEVDRRLQEHGQKTSGVTARVTGAAQEAATRVTDTAVTAAARAQEAAGAAAATVADTAAGMAAAVQDRGVQGLSEDLTGLIRRYPVPALLIGLGLGYVLGRSFRTGRTARGRHGP